MEGADCFSFGDLAAALYQDLGCSSFSIVSLLLYASPKKRALTPIESHLGATFNVVQHPTLAPPVFASSLQGSHRRPDVLVHAEKVGRVIFLLERDQAIIVRTIGGLGAFRTFVTEIVYVDGAGRERAHRAPKTVGPFERRLRLRRLLPVRIHPKIETAFPDRERGFARADPTDGASVGKQPNEEGTRSAHDVVDDHVDAFIG